MSRLDTIRQFITKDMAGIEIAPWYSPITPKRDGYNCKTVDIFDKQTLIEKNQNGTSIPDNKIQDIEEVDFVGSATDIADLIPNHGEYDYIVSSHNFEHLPNPIKFLQGCSTVLNESGIVSMAIPDRRGMFDYYRPRSTTGDLIEAYRENRVKPTGKQQFDHHGYGANYAGRLVFLQLVQPEFITPNELFAEAYDCWDADTPATEYADVHCWVFTTMSFELIMLELRFLGLIDFEVISITSDGGAEFFVHMKKVSTKMSREEFYARRRELLIKLS